tara:strand:+ start:276 stop:1139 length:864 start_codon:yes stop_codon:yes gene_type:complete
MKKWIAFIAVAGIITTVGFITTSVSSQQPRGERDQRRPGPPPPDPILILFDTDRDGSLSEQEIEQATAVLKKLDRDQNGKLTREELPRPPRPGDVRHDRSGEHRPPRPGKEPMRDKEPQTPVSQNAPAGSVIFTGGYETDPRDHGRPVSLIAAALDVESQVFRDAFSNVNPARNGAPTEARVHANKKVLLDALGKHGVTNDRLDEVSNYYRYQPGRGELWKYTPTSATAIIKNGKVTGFKISNPGSGYTTPPMVTVAGHEQVQVKAILEFSKNFRNNGSIKSLTIVE